jgi:Ni,Fe-hydrogenase maturation factor
MDTTIINHINTGGIGFTTPSEITLKIRKEYSLTITDVLQNKSIETKIKIIIIEIIPTDNGNVCRALFRELTDEQITALKRIAADLSNPDAIITTQITD